MTTYFKSHSWLWAQQTQAIDSHCFHMQLWTTTFLFTIFHEDIISENRDNGSFSIISLTEVGEALSEGQFVKQTCDTYFVWSWRSGTKLWYWFLHVLGTLPIFFQDNSSDNDMTESTETPMSVSASQNTTLEKNSLALTLRQAVLTSKTLTIQKYLQWENPFVLIKTKMCHQIYLGGC